MIGRKEEKKELESRYNSGKFEFGVVYGNRRIGKSTLLTEFTNSHNGFIFQAKDAQYLDNLASLSREFGLFTNKGPNLSYSQFEDFLDDLIEESKKRRLIFVLDEFPYLAKSNKIILSIIQEYVDRKFQKGNIVFILSGSSVSFMKELLEDKTNALYKRETFKIHLQKMKFEEALEFLNDVNNIDKGNYLSLFSTYPYYLSMIDTKLSFEENLIKLVFSKFCPLLDAPNNVMPIGSANNKMFNSILYQISKRKTSPKDISNALKVDSNYLSTYLKQLLEMSIVEKREMFNTNKKQNYYVISDTFLNFYYRFIFDYSDLILLGGGERYFETIKDEIYSFLGHGFEDVVNKYMNEKNLDGKLPHFYNMIQNYKVENSKLGRSIEIDGLAEDIKKHKDYLLVIESKYTNKSLSKNVLDHLKESVSVFGNYKVIDYYLFSKNGFSNDISSLKDEHVHLVNLDDMFENKI